MSQTTHVQDFVQAFEGMLVDGFTGRTVTTGIATLAIPFGHFVAHDGAATENPPTVKLPTLTGEVTDGGGLGVVIADTSIEHDPSNPTGYADEASVPILRRGRIWVISESTVSAVGAAAFVRFASGGGGSVLGAFRTDADTATAVAFPGARFMTTTSGANQLALLEIYGQ